MILVGLTGGIATGKTTSAKWLAEHSIPVIDTDEVARELVAPGEPALAEIHAEFGSAVLAEDGSLNRPALAAVVFGDSEARSRLEHILHPRIRSRWQEEAGLWRERNVAVGVVVIPLLFETGAESAFDLIVCTACTASTQQSRLEARGWDAAQIRGRMDAQMGLSEKMAKSDVIIWTEGERSLAGAQWNLARTRDGRALFPAS